MFSIATNLFVFTAYILVLIIEFIFMKIFDFGFSTTWLITTLIYIMFIAYQILARTNEYLEKGKVKEIIYSIMDAVNGIPLINQDNRIVIQWEVIFKKLIDKKAYYLYDNIIKVKTKTIDHYVNQYPSLLLNSSMDIIEKNNRIDTKSLIKRSGKEVEFEDKEQDLSENMKDIIYVKYLNNDKVTFGNYDSSIYVDVLMNEEFEPQEYELLSVKPDPRYDGFSLIAYYKDIKYVIVPRTMVFEKRIDKEKWLYRNIDKIMQCVKNIVSGIQDYEIIIDELSLKDLLSDYYEDSKDKIPELHFDYFEDSVLVFSGSDRGKEIVKAYCLMETSHSGFELKLIKHEIIIDDINEVIEEEEKTIAIGNTYQPLITIMENMPIISNNIKMVISNKDIEELVIK